MEAARAGLGRANARQNEIWTRAEVACQPSPNLLQAQIVSSLNQMFDITSTRMAAAQIHPPTILFIKLAVLA